MKKDPANAILRGNTAEMNNFISFLEVERE